MNIKWMLCTLAWAAAASTQAQAPSTDAALSWRVTSRLGYGPTPARAQATQVASAAQAWSLAQIQEAKAASAQPAKVPEAIQKIAMPLPEVMQHFRQETSRRDRVTAAGGMANMAAGEMGGMAAAPAPSPNRAELRSAMQARREADRSADESSRPRVPAADLQPFAREMAQGIGAWRLMACSNPEIEQPMLARMTEFWFNHFNVFVGKGPVRTFLPSYVLHAIRPNALGKFEDLLMATAKHPAMLYYLDQTQSVAEGVRLPGQNTARGLNENYARELLELHTLGVNGGYSQADVRELARILTGWGVGVREDVPFRFADRVHDKGSKTFMGTAYQAGGVKDAEAAIRSLARHPATAQRIATRLAQWFVADAPSPELVKRLSEAFTRSGGDIATVMTALVSSPEFLSVDGTSRLVKTPLDTACSTLLARSSSGAAPDRGELQRTSGFLQNAGHGLHAWQTPDGYKTDAATWLAGEALTRRADYVLQTTGNLAPEQTQWLSAYASPRTRERVAKEPAAQQVGLLLASPEFMTK